MAVVVLRSSSWVRTGKTLVMFGSGVVVLLSVTMIGLLVVLVVLLCVLPAGMVLVAVLAMVVVEVTTSLVAVAMVAIAAAVELVTVDGSGHRHPAQLQNSSSCSHVRSCNTARSSHVKAFVHRDIHPAPRVATTVVFVAMALVLLFLAVVLSIFE